MNLIAKIKRLPTVAILVILAVAIYIGVKLVMFLSVAFVYLGWNLFVYLENLLQFTLVNPLLMWGILGLFIGSIFGVIIAVKKYKLPKKLIFYPFLLTILLIVILSFINNPSRLSGSLNTLLNTNTESDVNNNNATETPAYDLYTVTQAMNVRQQPSLRSNKLFSVPRNARVRLIENVKDNNNTLWSKIEYTNPKTGLAQTGYLKYKYLQN